MQTTSEVIVNIAALVLTGKTGHDIVSRYKHARNGGTHETKVERLLRAMLKHQRRQTRALEGAITRQIATSARVEAMATDIAILKDRTCNE